MGALWSKGTDHHLQLHHERKAAEQLALQSMLLEQEKAVELAATKTVVRNEFYAAFLAVGLLLLSRKVSKSYIFILPVIPMVVGMMMNIDLMEDQTLNRIKGDAEKILRENHDMVEPIGGEITLAEIDRRISRKKLFGGQFGADDAEKSIIN